MWDFLSHLFDTSDFPARWQCGTWSAGHGWLHIISDLGVWSAYVAIPCVLGYFILRKKDVPFRTIFLLFGAFILACGTTHLMEALLFWWPAYRLAGLIKLGTALISWGTVLALVPVTPQALRMATPAELEAEIARRKEAEAKLLASYADLERQVQERTLALQESEARHRLLVALHPDAILVHDGERVVFANPAAAQLLGRQAPEELLGRSHLDYVHPNFHAALRARWETVFTTGQPASKLEQKWVRADGSSVTVEAAVYRFPGQRQPQLQIVARDVTERKRSEERVRVAVEAAPNGVLMVKRDGTITLANGQVRKMFGYTAEELIDQPVEKLVPQRWRHDHPASRAGFFANPRTRSMGAGRELFGLRKDGSEFPVEIGLQPIHMEEGVFVLASIIDVSERRQAETALRQSEQRFARFMQHLAGLAWIKDLDGRYVYVNDAAEQAFGRRRSELYGQSDEDIFAPASAALFREHDRLALTRGTGVQVIETLTDQAGMPRHSFVTKFPIPGPDGQAALLGGIALDITDRMQAEEQLRTLNATLEQRVAERAKALREQEERFRSAFDFASIGMALVALNGRWLRVNRSLCQLVGYSEQELLATDFQSITHPEDLDADLQYVQQLLAGTIKTYQMEKRYFHKSGQIVHVLLAVSLVRDTQDRPLYFVSQIQDITQRKQAEEQTIASLQEKEVLLKEIHHRVKNNLQVISSLLDLQAQYTRDAASVEMFRESQNRVRSMALVHERLYQSESLSNIDFADYLQNLVAHLTSTYSISTGTVRFDLDLAPVRLSIDAAVPCGLAVNELVSNCLKYAFPNQRNGVVRIRLNQSEGEILLAIQDDGIGLPEQVTLHNPQTFGLRLVNALVDQLHGRAQIDRSGGTTIQLTFPAPRTNGGRRIAEPKA